MQIIANIFSKQVPRLSMPTKNSIRPVRKAKRAANSGPPSLAKRSVIKDRTAVGPRDASFTVPVAA